MSRKLMRSDVNYNQMLKMLVSALSNKEDIVDLTLWEINFIKSKKHICENYNSYRKYLTRQQKDKIIEIWSYMFEGADFSTLYVYCAS